MLSSETDRRSCEYKVISFNDSNTKVRIQTQIFVAQICIKPKRAITLKRWMFNWNESGNIFFNHLFSVFSLFCTNPCVHEDEVHLHKGENHLQQWIDTT